MMVPARSDGVSNVEIPFMDLISCFVNLASQNQRALFAKSKEKASYTSILLS
jgi:hypothetical protein